MAVASPPLQGLGQISCGDPVQNMLVLAFEVLVVEAFESLRLICTFVCNVVDATSHANSNEIRILIQIIVNMRLTIM